MDNPLIYPVGNALKRNSKFIIDSYINPLQRGESTKNTILHFCNILCEATKLQYEDCLRSKEITRSPNTCIQHHTLMIQCLERCSQSKIHCNLVGVAENSIY